MQKTRSLLLLLGIIHAAFFLLHSTNAFAASSPLEMQTEDLRFVKWDLTADSLTSLNDEEILEAQGNVILRRGNDYLSADFARYYMSTKWVFLKGNVIVRMGGDEIKAAEAEFDLRSRVGWLKQGEIFMAGPHAYLSGARIDKHWGDIYTFKNAKISTCDSDGGKSPAWSLSADEAIVELDGYARLIRSAFQVKDVPIFYTPYMLFPTKTSRQTGLLTPSVGHSSKKGFTYNQPFFWAISQKSDMTFNAELMSKRGIMPGMEYRAIPTADSKVWLRADWLHDQVINKRIDTGQYTGDDKIRTNENRFWLRGMFDSWLNTSSWRLKADFDFVSDQDYLREFRNSFGGYSNTNEKLFQWFGRELQMHDRNRESGLLLTHDWERASVAFSGRYTQDPSLGHGNKRYHTDTNVQQLPQFDAFLHKGRIWEKLPLEFDAAAQAGYFYRRTGTSGGRYELMPNLTLPLLSRFGSLITRAGLRQTVYSIDKRNDTELFIPRSHWEGDTPSRQNGEKRTLPEIHSVANTEFARIYQLNALPLALSPDTIGQSQWSGLRHSIQPQVEFAYRSKERQKDNPYYDAEDRLRPQGEIIYSLTNVLTRKKQTVTAASSKDKDTIPVITDHYIDLIRFKLEQAYDYREAKRTDRRDQFSRRPFSDVRAELTIGLNQYFSLTSKNFYSPYRNEITRHESSALLSWPEYGFVSLGYDERHKIDEYNRRRLENIQFISGQMGLRLFNGMISLDASFNYDYKKQDNHETNIYLAYNHQCFSVIGNLSLEPDDKSYFLMVKLSGLGD